MFNFENELEKYTDGLNKNGYECIITKAQTINDFIFGINSVKESKKILIVDSNYHEGVGIIQNINPIHKAYHADTIDFNLKNNLFDYLFLVKESLIVSSFSYEDIQRVQGFRRSISELKDIRIQIPENVLKKIIKSLQ